MDAKLQSEQLEYIIRLVVAGEIEPVIDKVYAFEALPEAFAHLGSRRARGKIVVTLGEAHQ
jgi:NADPH:quinone reductase-like Zn-dependent oxidoreductase